jgi:hypothetical protein
MIHLPPASASTEDDDIDIDVGFDEDDFEEDDKDFEEDDEDFEIGIEEQDDEEDEIPTVRGAGTPADLTTSDMPALATGTHGTIEIPEDSTRHVRVVAFFQALDKLQRGIRLYEGRGFLVEKLAARMETRADAMVADGNVLVRVAPFGVLFDGNPINPAEDKPATYLFRLFCDGVRELTFSRPLDPKELRALADVLATDARSVEEDMTTLLWKKELKTVGYYATDTLQMDADLVDEDDLALANASQNRIRTDATEGEQLILSADDLRMLNADDALLWVRASRSPSRPADALKGTAVAIKGSFKKFGDYGRFVEMAIRAGAPDAGVSPLLMGLFDGVLASGEVKAVGGLLDAAAEAATHSEAGRALRDALLDEKRLPRLAGLLDRYEEELTEPIHAIGTGHPQALVLLLNLVRKTDVRDALRDRLLEQGIDMTTYYSERTKSDDPGTVIDAVVALGKIGGPDAVRGIIPALGATATAVRRAGLEAMGSSYHSDARVALGRALRDPDRDNRMLALTVLQRSGDARAAGAILTTVQTTRFNSRDSEEKATFYEALAAFKDRRTLEFFDSILGQRNITRSKVIAARQLTAVKALAAMGTDDAAQALLRASKRWYLPTAVREAADRGPAKSRPIPS